MADGSVTESDCQPALLNDEIVEREESVPAIPRSCVPLFDAMFFCYTPVNQFKVFYRTGNVAYCDELFKQFSTCLRSRLMSRKDAEELYRRRTKEREDARGPSVWTYKDQYLESLKTPLGDYDS
mmetsp:Transcript_30363/g.73985  ORF Transcript_30363/g.73985 Transcript_30363/m.73985 type:complete len:124 (-) Transcript_30363:1858-2229(-)